MLLDLRQVVYVLSDAVDLVGVDDVRHGKRVAFLAVEIARAAGLEGPELDELFHAALLHDCGVSTTREHQELVQAFDWPNATAHCRRGAALLAGFFPLAHLAQVVRYHHTRWDALGDAPNAPTDMEAFHANCVFLADRVDALLQQAAADDPVLARDQVLADVRAHSGSYFAPHLVDAFAELVPREAFWFTLDPQPLQRYLEQRAGRPRLRALEMDEVKELARMFARIVDAKSPFTAEHSLGVARVARWLALRVGLDAERADLLEVAGLLHDLGKLQVPDAILEKPGPLNEAEQAAMARHSFNTYQILDRIVGFQDVARWAALHHEELAGTGYPFHATPDELPIEARIVAVADVFQALAQDRPYRAGLSLQETLRILREMAASGKLDRGLVELVEAEAQLCWEAAVGAA